MEPDESSSAQLLSGQVNTHAESQLIVWRPCKMESYISGRDHLQLFVYYKGLGAYEGNGRKLTLKAPQKSYSRSRECHFRHGLIGATECGPSLFPFNTGQQLLPAFVVQVALATCWCQKQLD